MSRRPADLREAVPLSPLTTLQVGGDARLFLEVGDEARLVEALAWARDTGVSAIVLGGGSNVLVSDAGVDALVLRVSGRGVRTVETSESFAVMEVGAGEPLDAFVAAAVAHGYGGVECLSGIPGLVGATPIQNVGAYGQEVADTIREVRTIDRLTGAVRTFDNADCRFAYRTSIFKEPSHQRHVVTSVTFRLARGLCATPRYAELARALSSGGAAAAPTLARIRSEVLAIRRSKSMLVEPSDPNHRSAGSFFVNPTVSSDVALAVEDAVRARGVDASRSMPRFPAGAGVKLSAAWLIEQAGFAKGMSDGAVGLSTRHALCVVNRGGATARQIVAFASRIRAEVRARFGVALATEPVRIGFTPAEELGLSDGGGERGGNGAVLPG